MSYVLVSGTFVSASTHTYLHILCTCNNINLNIYLTAFPVHTLINAVYSNKYYCNGYIKLLCDIFNRW